MITRSYARRAILFCAVSILVAAGTASCTEMTEAFRVARDFCSAFLSDLKLSRTSGCDLFDPLGHRLAPVIFNFVGRDEAGDWMIISCEVDTDGRVLYDPVADAPRKDVWGHHEKAALELHKWIPMEEALMSALKEHPDHPPQDVVSMACFFEKATGLCVLSFYWIVEETIYFVHLDARDGGFVESGTVAMPPLPPRR